MAKPKLIVFDLDYTLWPFWVDTHVDPPFRKKKDGLVYDVNGRRVKPYPETNQVLFNLHKEGYTLAVASRTGCIDEARSLVRLYEWEKYFSYMEIYPGSKVNHFKRFQEESNLPYADMIFFDDEPRNITDVGRLGVTCILARDGITKTLLQTGLMKFAQNH